jgi:ribonuclease Z
MRACSTSSNFDQLLGLVKTDKQQRAKSPNRFHPNRENNEEEPVLVVLSNGNVGTAKSVLLKTNNQRYIFNCGEGTYRMLFDLDVYESTKPYDIVILNKSWKAMDGLLSFCNVDSLSTEKAYVHAPFDLWSVVSKTHAMIKLAISPSCFHDYSINKEFANKNLLIKAIEFKVEVEKLEPNEIFPTIRTRKNYAYVCELRKEKIRFALVDCQDPEFIDKLVESEELNACDIQLYVHFSSADVLNNASYQTWMKTHVKNQRHILLDETHSNLHSVRLYQLQCLLNKVDKNIYPLLKFESQSVEDSRDLFKKILTNKSYSNISQGLTNMVYNFNRRSFNTNACFSLDLDKFKKRVDAELPISFWTTVEADSHSSASRIPNENIYPETIFLGTGSTLPTPYRNVTAILVKIDSDTSILLDCGESTLGQFMRHFGADNYVSELKKVKAVFISHLHGNSEFE